jgi:hypothetical protein
MLTSSTSTETAGTATVRPAEPKFLGGGDLERFALYWEKCIESRRAVDADHIFDVSYEALTERPEETTRELMGALREAMEQQQLDPRRRSKDQRADTPRFRRLGRSINTSSQDRWKEEMSREEVRRFEGIAGDQLDAFGYDLLT